MLSQRRANDSGAASLQMSRYKTCAEWNACICDNVLINYGGKFIHYNSACNSGLAVNRMRRLRGVFGKKMVASWRRNYAHSIDTNSSEELASGSGESETESFIESDTETGESASALKRASSKAKQRGRKAVWSESHVTDMVDIICSSKYLRKNLIFRNKTCGRNSAIYDQVLKELQERLASHGEHFPLSVSQIRNKFKMCVAECKKAALTIKTATGIKRFQEEKKFVDWFQQL